MIDKSKVAQIAILAIVSVLVSVSIARAGIYGAGDIAAACLTAALFAAIIAGIIKMD